MVFTLDVVADVGAPDELLVVPSMMDCWREEVSMKCVVASELTTGHLRDFDRWEKNCTFDNVIGTPHQMANMTLDDGDNTRTSDSIQ